MILSVIYIHIDRILDFLYNNTLISMFMSMYFEIIDKNIDNR